MAVVYDCRLIYIDGYYKLYKVKKINVKMFQFTYGEVKDSSESTH